MPNTALITGASGGIGYELAKLFAVNRYDLILVARSDDKLEALQQLLQERYGIAVMVIAQDLTRAGAADAVYEQVMQAGWKIDALVNNAGFGDYGAYVSRDWQRQLDMVELNIVALMRLTHLFLPQMLMRGKGHILNLSSVAAFYPGPRFAVYYASKAFVQSFSEALHAELRSSGVTVTALCPGPTKTGFEQAAFLSSSRLFRVIKPADAASVAAYGFRAMRRGRPVAVPGIANKIAVYGSRLLPRNVVRFLSEQMNLPARAGIVKSLRTRHKKTQSKSGI